MAHMILTWNLHDFFANSWLLSQPTGMSGRLFKHSFHYGLYNHSKWPISRSTVLYKKLLNNEIDNPKWLIIVDWWENYSISVVFPQIWTKLSPLNPKILCGKCGQNWHSNSVEKIKNDTMNQADIIQTLIRKAKN